MGESAATSRLMVLTGNANPALAEALCADLGVQLGNANVSRFPDGEIEVKVRDDVRGADVFIVQPTCAPPNETLMELLLLIDSVERASAHRVTAVMPYYGYARKDRKDEGRVPIAAKVVANMLTTAGVDRVLTMDLHAGQIQGFFNIPVDHMYFGSAVTPTLERYVKPDATVLVSPDAGGVERARHYAKKFDCELAVIDKRRDAPNVVGEMRIIGDVAGKIAILLDDLIDTAGTLTKAATALKENKATKVYACCTHPVLSGPAIERIEKSELAKLIVSDSIPLRDEAKKCRKIQVVSTAKVLGEAVRRIHNSESVSSLFE